MKITSKFIVLLVSVFIIQSCVSTRLTIKNIDDNAPAPVLVTKDRFLVTEYTSDKKYGYDPDYPINVFYRNTNDEALNATRYLNALAGPNGEEIFYIKIETCCPFPSKRTNMGAGLLDVYEISWKGQSKPVRLYLNIYEKGYLYIPVGFTAKK
jgi:hypothetical protein